MDPKKQDLNPELKQVYDRVMNTKVASQPSTGTPSAISTPRGTARPGLPDIPQVKNSAPGQMPPPETQPQTSQGEQGPFLSSAPPRPVSPGSGSFVFTGNKVITQGTEKVQASGGKGIFSSKIILFLVLILIVVWGVLWAKIFGLF